jgi:hypothetical protein
VINNGQSNNFCIQLEPSYGAASSADIIEYPTRTRFTWQPINEGGGDTIGIYRTLEKSSFSRIHYRGTLEFEAGINIVFPLLLKTFLQQISSVQNSPSAGLETTTFIPPRLGAFESMKFLLDYKTEGPFLTFNGLVIEKRIIFARAQAITTCRIEFKFSTKTTRGSAVTTHRTVSNRLITGAKCELKLNGSPLPGANEFSITFSDPKTPEGFAEDKAPTKMVRRGMVDISGELVEYLDTFTIPNLVESLGEASIEFLMKDAGSRQTQIVWPRVIFTIGTPELFGKTEIPLRASWKGLLDADRNPGSEPKVVTTTGTVYSFLLLEGGAGFLLLEGGGKLILEPLETE